MFKLELLAATARTASLLLVQDKAKYHLHTPQAWQLYKQGEEVQSGMSDRTGLFLSELEPETTYIFECSGISLQFATSACGGFVEASDFGISATKEDNCDAFSAAIAATPANGTLSIPRGNFQTRPLFLKSDMTVHFEEGAQLSAVSSREGWPILSAHGDDDATIGSWEGLPSNCYAAVITAIDCHNLHITGNGIIDGGGDVGDWWEWPKGTRDGARRARTLHLVGCTNCSLTGVQVQNSPSWTVHPYRCKSVHFSNITILNPADSPNTDGLNPESCENTSIVASRFTVGDDCIAVKAGKKADDGYAQHLAPTMGLLISHCLMEKGHGAVVLGSEMSGSITNVRVEKCEFDGTDRGIRIKTRRGRGGKVENVFIQDVLMRNVPAPITANSFYFCDHDGKSEWVQDRTPHAVDGSTPHVQNIEIRDVVATGVEQVGIALLGLPEAPIKGVLVDNFQIQFNQNSTPGVPLMALHVPEMCNVDAYCEFAQLQGQVVQLDGTQQQ